MRFEQYEMLVHKAHSRPSLLLAGLLILTSSSYPVTAQPVSSVKVHNRPQLFAGELSWHRIQYHSSCQQHWRLLVDVKRQQRTTYGLPASGCVARTTVPEEKRKREAVLLCAKLPENAIPASFNEKIALAYKYSARGTYGAALELLAAARRQGELNWDQLMLSAQIKRQVKDFAGAFVDVNAAIQKDPTRQSALIYKATLIISHASSPGGAAKVLDLVDQKLCTDVERRDVLVLRGCLAVFEQRRDAAWHFLQEADRYNNHGGDWLIGNYGVGWENLAGSYFAACEFDKARYCAERAVQLSPRMAEGYYRKGLCEIQAGAFRSAVVSLSKCIDICSVSVCALQARASVYNLIKDTEGVRSDLVRLNQLDPTTKYTDEWLQTACLAVCESMRAHGQQKSAVELLNKVLRGNPTLVAALLMKASILAEFKQPDTDREAYLALKHIQLKACLQCQLTRVISLLIQLDHLDEAERLLTVNKLRQPAYAQCWVELSAEYFSRTNFSAAKRCAEMTLKCDEKERRGYHFLGKCLAREGRFEEALDQYNIEIELCKSTLLMEDALKERAAMNYLLGNIAAVNSDLIQLRKLPKMSKWTMLGIASISLKYSSDPIAVVRRDFLAFDQRQREKHIEELKEKIASETDDRRKSKLLSEKAELQLLVAQYAGTIEDIDQSVKLGGDSVHAHAIRAAALVSLKRFAEARRERQLTVDLYSANGLKRQND